MTKVSIMARLPMLRPLKAFVWIMTENGRLDACNCERRNEDGSEIDIEGY